MRGLGVFLRLLAPWVAVLLVSSSARAQPEDIERLSDDSVAAADASAAGETEGADAADAGDEQTSDAGDGQEISPDSWNDDWFDQAEPEASTTAATHPRYSPLELEANVGNLSRSFSYSDDLSQSLRSYSAPSGLIAAGALTWFPGAHFTGRAPAHLGLSGRFEFGLPQNTADGIGASMTEWHAGLVGRVPFAGGRVAPEGLLLGRIEGGQHSFVVDADPNGLVLVASVKYDFVRVALGARLNLSQRVLFELDAGVRFPFDEGQLSGPQWFPRAEATGLDAAGRVGVRFAPVDVFVGAAHERYFFTFDPNPDGPNPAGIAAGATDAYWAFTVGIRYSLPPSGR